MRRYLRPPILLATVAVAALVLGLAVSWMRGPAVGWGALFGAGDPVASADGQMALSWRDIPFDGKQAYTYLKALCELGPRPTGSEGMRRQQALLREHFTQLGGRLLTQEFEVRHPETGQAVPVVNLVVEWHPERQQRILLCAHYDTRPFPDRDPQRRRGVFVGANDGASGVALLMELGRHLRELQSPYGVDFVLFDAEEFVFDDGRDKDYYFVGSTYFARAYAGGGQAHQYRWGVLLDMVADAQLQIYQESNSLHYARPVVNQIWNTARRLGVSEFIPRKRHDLRDDHIPLNEIARIPTCDLIDFDYPRPGLAGVSYWHTQGDTPDKCSAESLAKVGWVVLEWLRSTSADSAAESR